MTTSDKSNSGGYIYKCLREVGISHMSALNLCQHIKAFSCEPGHVIGRRGAEMASWNYIISGMVSATIISDNSISTPIAIYGQKTWFGESAIVNQKPSNFDYVCLTEVDMLCMPAALMRIILGSEFEFSSTVMRMVSWRAQSFSETLMLMKLGNPCLRVVLGLCQFAESLQYNADRPPTIGMGQGVSIPVKQETIAKLCGVSRTLFSENILELSRHSWLRITYSKIEFVNIHKWQKFASVQRSKALTNLNPSMKDILVDLEETTKDQSD